MSRIEINHLDFTYEGSFDPVFEDVTLQLDTNWRLGLIGRNGRGKTTLLRLLMGVLPHEGAIRTTMSFDYFPFPVRQPQNSTEVILAEICGQPSWMIRRECARLDLREDTLARPFVQISPGEQTKALLAALFLKEGHFLLIDEPTNHLDLEARAVLGRYLSQKHGFILVSHDRALLDRCVDHVLSINRHTITLMQGDFSTWWREKELKDHAELEENARLHKEIGRLQSAARQASTWSDQVEKSKYATRNAGLRPDRGYIGHKAAKMMKRAKTLEQRREQAIEEKSALLKEVETTERLKLSPLRFHSKCLADLRQVQLLYGEEPVGGPITFQLLQGDRVALVGRNGTGKSTLLKALLAAAHYNFPQTAFLGQPLSIPCWNGELYVPQGISISYVPQSAAGLSGSFSDYAAKYQVDEVQLRAILRKLDFSRTQFEKDLSECSAGQKKKVLLARSLCERAHIYIWDEPLNYLDVWSRIQIEELLAQNPLTLLFVEHDQTFQKHIATNIISLA